MSQFRRALRDLRNYPSAVAGLLIIFALVATAVYAMIAIPFDEAIRLWRGGPGVWDENPQNAWPIWYNWFVADDLPRSIVLSSEPESAGKESNQVNAEMREVTTNFTFDFPYEAFPRSVVLFYDVTYDRKQPLIALNWITPDGRELPAGNFQAPGDGTYRFDDRRLERRLDGLDPAIGLFAEPELDPPQPLQGTYELQATAFVFEEDSDVDFRFIAYGQVHGLAGTDHRRRDLMVGLLWGTPIALAFGLLAAVGTTITTMLIAAVGVWFGGLVDASIQRITEVNLILPLLPVLIMVGTFYSRSIWMMLGVVILLSIFGAGIKTYRAVFLQVKESSYIEAARAYGASNTRIIMSYLVPRVLPLVIPNLVVLVPTFVFLEASLAVLGLGDPVLPTWGKIIQEANSQGALFNGYYYWVLEPAALLMLAGLGFALVGFALDRIFNPRLREL